MAGIVHKGLGPLVLGYANQILRASCPHGILLDDYLFAKQTFNLGLPSASITQSRVQLYALNSSESCPLGVLEHYK